MTLSNQGPFRQRLGGDELDGSWLDDLGWPTAGAFLVFLLLSAAVGWFGLQHVLDSGEARAFGGALFCGYVLISGLLALLMAWIGSHFDRGMPWGCKSAFAVTLAVVLALGGVGVFMMRPDSEPQTQSIRELFDRARQRYADHNFGVDVGLSVKPIMFTIEPLEVYIETIQEMTRLVEGEDRLILEALTSHLKEIQHDHVAYQQSWNNVNLALAGRGVDRVKTLQYSRFGDDTLAGIERLDARLAGFSDHLTEVLRVSGIDPERAASLAADYVYELDIPLQRRALAIESDLLKSGQQFADLTQRYPHFFDAEGWLVEPEVQTPEITAQYQSVLETFDELVVISLEFDAMRAEIFAKLRPGSLAADEAKRLYDLARANYTIEPVLSELGRLITQVFTQLPVYFESEVLWPEQIRSRDQIAQSQRLTTAFNESVDNYLAYYMKAPFEIESRLRKAELPEDLIDASMRELNQSEIFLKGYEHCQILQEDSETQLALLELYEREFGRWSVRQNGRVWFDSSAAGVEFMILEDRFLKLSRTIETRWGFQP